MTSKESASGIEGRDTRIDIPLQGCQDPTKERKKQAQKTLNSGQQATSNESNLYTKAEHDAGEDSNCSCENLRSQTPESKEETGKVAMLTRLTSAGN
jgi:hypothetical protein